VSNLGFFLKEMWIFFIRRKKKSEKKYCEWNGIGTKKKKRKQCEAKHDVFFSFLLSFSD